MHSGQYSGVASCMSQEFMKFKNRYNVYGFQEAPKLNYIIIIDASQVCCACDWYDFIVMHVLYVDNLCVYLLLEVDIYND